MRLHPVNPAEAIIAPFFDPALSALHEWKLEAGPDTLNLRLDRGYTPVIAWDSAKAGTVAVTWTWRGRLDLSSYNGFFLQAACGSSTTIRLRARLDNQWQTIIEARGRDSTDDYTGSFHGSILEELRLELIPHTDAAGAFLTYYLGVHHDDRLQDWLAYENNCEVYSPDWPEFIKPESEWGELVPQIGLYFDTDDLERLRRKIAIPPYKKLADTLHEQAHRWLALEPEKQIRQYMGCGDPPFAYSARARDRGLPLWGPMEQCAFFGLLHRNPQLIRMAARCAISAVHVRHWSEGLAEHNFPGSASNWRSFYQNCMIIGLAGAFDWIGAVLTPHAREVLCHSLHFKGLSTINYDFGRYEYIYHMNQAACFSAGRIAGLLILRSHWPAGRVEWMLEQAHKDLDEVSWRIIHEDGGYGEGPNYYAGAAYYMAYSYLLLARWRSVPVESLVPPGLLRGMDYFGCFISTTRKAAKLLLSDNVDPQVFTDQIALCARVCNDARWNYVLAQRLELCDEQVAENYINLVWRSDSVRTLIYGPDDLSAQQQPVPVLRIHTSSGHATSRRETTYGAVRLHLSGAASDEEHSHQDKGAILLEAFGEDMLIDRGTTIYNDPMTGVLKTARLHNLVTPLNVEGYEMDQINPCPQAVIPQGNGDEQSLHLYIDTTAAWPKPVLKMNRTVDSPHPLSFTITDDVELAEPLAVVFHLHSYTPIEWNGNTATFTGAQSTLRVIREWPGEVMSNAQELFDFTHQPVYHLAVRTHAAISHHLITHLQLVPLPEPIGWSRAD